MHLCRPRSNWRVAYLRHSCHSGNHVVTADYSLDGVRSQLTSLDVSADAYATRFVDALLTAGQNLAQATCICCPPMRASRFGYA